jgi:O-methyltransferase
VDIRYVIQRAVNRCGYRVERLIPTDITRQSAVTIRRVSPFTRTSPEAIAALCSATEYIERSRIPGDVVECGVWEGGSMMAVALTLGRLGALDRILWLYDTYAGMTSPGPLDVRIFDGAVAVDGFESGRLGENAHKWVYADLEVVEKNMATTDYPSDRVRFVVGPVEETIPDSAPDQIALLRLDTDFHDSTLHELEHLYPRLSRGGVLVVDDYGSWRGARKAVDDYVASHDALHLIRVDPSVHVAVKL